MAPQRLQRRRRRKDGIQICSFIARPLAGTGNLERPGSQAVATLQPMFNTAHTLWH